MVYQLSSSLLYGLSKLLFRFEILGRKAIPARGPFILASNHLSNFDPPLLAIASPRRICFLAKEELFSNSLFRFYLHSVGAIPIKRYQTDIKALRLALKTLRQKPLLVFPQGTRSHNLDEPLAGIGFLVKKTGVPVVAAYIWGTDKVLPKGKILPRFCKLKVKFGRVEDIKQSDSREQITAKVVAAIKNLST